MNTLTITFLVIWATLAYASALPANAPVGIGKELPAAVSDGLDAQESRWGGGGHRWGGGGQRWGGGGGHHWGGGGHYWGGRGHHGGYGR